MPTILDARDYYKPFRYPWAYDYYKMQAHEQHWSVSEISFKTDIDHYHQLREPEKEFLRKIFAFFVQADADIAGTYVRDYLPTFKAPELRMMLGAFSNMESNHMMAYAELVETLGFQDYKNFLKYPEMEEKHKFITHDKKSPESIGDIMYRIAVGSAFGEGLQLFGSFVMLLSFAERGLLPGVRSVISWSMRDETIHVAGLIKLFHELKKDYPIAWCDIVKRSIYKAASEMTELEDRFISLIYTDDLELPNLPKETLHQYIRYLADHRLGQLGLKPVYYVDSNPIEWVTKYSNQLHEDLFQNPLTNYVHRSFNVEDMY